MQYRISPGKHNFAWKRGQMLNMSAGGIFMDASEPLTVGSTLELAIDWPGLYHDKPVVRLLVTGSVVRNDGQGTALSILSHQFHYVNAPRVPLPVCAR